MVGQPLGICNTTKLVGPVCILCSLDQPSYHERMGKVVCDRHKNNENNYTGPLACYHVAAAIRDSGARLPVVRVIGAVTIEPGVVERFPLALCEACCMLPISRPFPRFNDRDC